MTFLVAALVAIAAAPNITGTWNMGLQGGHVIPTALVLKQDGTSLTGTIVLPTQDPNKQIEVALSGEIADGVFKLTGTVENAKEAATLTIDGKILEDGTLEGQVDLPGHAHLPWTAERLKNRKP
ncbi:MAG TPA: hypothetical protein VGY48_07320 [Vicinamibacterales bacterium]|jgi:hypothetical protein|nr:hypothetical protein [Vicinamibacterales bacterium]